MFESDKRILRLIDYLVYQKIVPNSSAFLDSIGFWRQNLTKIRKGEMHFTPDHIQMICKVYNVNANWIIAVEKNTFRTPESVEITDFPAHTLTSTQSANKKDKTVKK